MTDFVQVPRGTLQAAVDALKLAQEMCLTHKAQVTLLAVAESIRPLQALLDVKPVWDNGDEPLVAGGLIRHGKVDAQIKALLDAPKVERKPLSEAEILALYTEHPQYDVDMIHFTRAIEAAHGIKEQA